MEQVLNNLNFQTAKSEDNSKLYDELDKIRRNGGIKAEEIKKCFHIFHCKVCVTTFPSELQDGYYCATHCLKELLSAMEYVMSLGSKIAFNK